jgi:hypothetical protein
MSFIETLTQLDWTRGVRMWIFVAAALAAWEAAFLFNRAIKSRNNGERDAH